MATLRVHPVLHEINTCAWLNELSQRAGRHVSLASVPEEDWEALAAWKMDAIWLMGVWERSPQGLSITLQDEGLMAEFRRALPDFTPEDVAGSPYCVRQYEVDQRFGGRKGLAEARKALAQSGIGLVLDFVPNHLAPDHPWVMEHPEYFILGDATDLRRAPTEFRQVGQSIIARGRDPYFPPWHDVLQLNAFDPGLRKSAIVTLKDIASQCDGVRCDMAMLLITEIFEQTWGERAGARPQREFWAEVIEAVKVEYPDFVFIAEAYWDREWDLQQLGFDYCYDKRLYDRLVHDNATSVLGHLHADLEYQEKLLRFIENHDEPRAAATFSPEKERAAAVAAGTQMGIRLFHDGQFEGRKIKQPIFLTRRPIEPPDSKLQEFYRRLINALRSEALHTGEWRLCTSSGWPDNMSYQNLVAWIWYKAVDLALVVVNLSENYAQGHVQVPWEGAAGRSWNFTDVLTGQKFERDGDEMCDPGLFVDLPPWGVHFFVS